ncbi:hypothetical protein E8E12_000228 [Didymella heteroderae]|uniref:Uncharacterized protein n=1 Tax=Didymella heteroderae TaxID=1769908 RepID=A0A9P4WFR3_9PLEO|nr:hypothetical protein E8E12_000228 [Didymella heteroderae]
MSRSSVFETGADLAEIFGPDTDCPKHRFLCRMFELNGVQAKHNQKDEGAFFKTTLRTLSDFLDEENAEAFWERNKAAWKERLDPEVWRDAEMLAETFSTKTYACKLASFPFENRHFKNKNVYFKLILCILRDVGTTKRKRGAAQEGPDASQEERDAFQGEAIPSKRACTLPPRGPAETETAASNHTTQTSSAISAINSVMDDAILESYLFADARIGTPRTQLPHSPMPGIFKWREPNSTDWWIGLYGNRRWFTHDDEDGQTLIKEASSIWQETKSSWQVTLTPGLSDAFCTIRVSQNHELLPRVAALVE